MFDFLFKKRQPRKLWYSTDIHSHVIPGIDDGSPDADTSLQLINRMRNWGISRIIASPHVTDETFMNTKETITPAFEALKHALNRAGDTMPVSHTAEYRIDELLMQNIADNTLMPYPNNYLLIENSYLQEPWNLDQLLFDLQVRGLKPIMAHPERFTYYHQRRQRYHELHDAGALFQINVLSLAGYYGKPEKHMAEYLIENDLVDFCGTDLHHFRHADAIDKYLRSSESVRHAKALQNRIFNDRAFL